MADPYAEFRPDEPDVDADPYAEFRTDGPLEPEPWFQPAIEGVESAPTPPETILHMPEEVIDLSLPEPAEGPGSALATAAIESMELSPGTVSRSKQQTPIDKAIAHNIAKAENRRAWDTYNEMPVEERAKTVPPIMPLSPFAEAELRQERGTAGLTRANITRRNEMMYKRGAGRIADVDWSSPYEQTGASYIAGLLNTGRSIKELFGYEIDNKVALKWFKDRLKFEESTGKPQLIPEFMEELYLKMSKGPAAEAVREMQKQIAADTPDKEKLKDIEVLWPGESPEKPSTFAAEVLQVEWPSAWPRIPETSKSAVHEIVGLYQIPWQIPGAISGTLGKKPTAKKMEAIGSFVGGVRDYYGKRLKQLQQGDIRAVIEEAPIGTVFDLGMGLGGLSKLALKAEANLIREAIKQSDAWNQPHLFRIKRSVDHLDDVELIESIKKLGAESRVETTKYPAPVRKMRELSAKQKAAKTQKAEAVSDIERATVNLPVIDELIKSITEVKKKITKDIVEPANRALRNVQQKLERYSKHETGSIMRVSKKYRHEWRQADAVVKRSRWSDADSPFADQLSKQVADAAKKKEYYENLSAKELMDDLIEARARNEAAKIHRAEQVTATLTDARTGETFTMVLEDAITGLRKDRKITKQKRKSAEKMSDLVDVTLESIKAEKLEVRDIIKSLSRESVVTNMYGRRESVVKKYGRKKGTVPPNMALYNAKAMKAVADLSDVLRKTITPWSHLTGLNLLKNRLLDYERGAKMDVHTKARLRQLLRDPDLIIPEIVFNELRAAQGAVDDFGFAAAEMYKRIPEEYLKMVHKDLHFEHQSVTRYFKWAEDADGNIYYKVKPEYAKGLNAQRLQHRVDLMNEWSAPLATLIRNRVTKVGVELDIFNDSSAILGRTWAPNMMKQDLEAISAMTDQRIRGAALKDNTLRQTGVSIEAREWPVGKSFPEKGPASIAAQRTEAAKDIMRERMKRDEGGWGMNENLAEELLLGVADAVRDFELVRSLRNISKDPGVAVRNNNIEISYINAAGESKILKTQKRPGFVKLSDVLNSGNKKLSEKVRQKWKETTYKKDPTRADKTVKQYGALTDMYVHPDVAYFIKAQEDLAAFHRSSAFAKGLGFWKAGKTILSPATHATNYLSNGLILAPMAGISPWNPFNWKFFGQAKKDMIMGNRSKDWKEFIVGGGRGRKGTPQRSEFAQQADTAAAMLHGGAIGRGKNFLKEMEVSYRKTLAGEGKIRVGKEQAANLTKQLYRETGALYQAGDDFYRYALFLKNRANGMSIADAVAASRKAFADYENLAGIFHVIKNSTLGIPFVSFEVRMSPRVVKWMMDNPHQGALLKQLGDYWTMRNMAEAGVSLEEINAMRSELPSYMQQSYSPWAAMAPGMWNRKGNSRGWAATGKYGPAVKFIPDVDEIAIWETGESTSAAMEYVKRIWGGGGPVGASISIWGFDRHPHYKSDIKTPEDKFELWRQMILPNLPIAPWSTSYERLAAAYRGEARPGRTFPESVAQAFAASVVGIRDVEFTLRQMIGSSVRKSQSEYRDKKALIILQSDVSDAKKKIENKMFAMMELGTPKEERRRVQSEMVTNLYRPVLAKLGHIKKQMERRRGLNKRTIRNHYSNIRE